MPQPTSQRPPQATFAGWLALVGSAIVVASNFSAAGSLRSLESLERLEEMVSEPPFAGTVSVEQAITALHATLVVGSMCAAVVGIFAWFALRGSKQARLVMTVLAVPLFVTGVPAGGFASAVVAASVLMLWIPPAREWYRDGVWTPPPPLESGRSERSTPRDPHAPGARPPMPPGPGTTGEQQPWAGQRPTVAPPGATGDRPGPHPVPFGQGAQPGWPPAGQPRPLEPAGPQSPPRAVRTILAMTIVGGLSASLSFVVAALTSDHARAFAEMQKSFPGLFEQAGYTLEMFRIAMYATAGLVVLWAVAAVVLAVLVMRRQGWARIVLVIFAALVAPYGILAALSGDVLLLVSGVTAVVSLFLLRDPAVRQWVSRRR